MHYAYMQQTKQLTWFSYSLFVMSAGVLTAGTSSYEPYDWPTTLDVLMRAELTHVLSHVFKSAQPQHRVIRWLHPKAGSASDHTKVCSVVPHSNSCVHLSAFAVCTRLLMPCRLHQIKAKVSKIPIELRLHQVSICQSHGEYIYILHISQVASCTRCDLDYPMINTTCSRHSEFPSKSKFPRLRH